MIEVNGLTKIYDGFRAVDNVDLVAKGGKVTILLGPNGLVNQQRSKVLLIF